MRRSLLAVLIVLSACSGSGPTPPGVKIGKPYVVGGVTYYPEYDASYDETGIASWYGPGFHGGRTANGEKFDTHDLTCAHPTLPMPSLVRVTNLENGKAAIVRVNDRGPFARNRIVDLSSAAAKRLNVQGLAKVRVQFLREETEQYLAAIQEGRRIDLFAFNDQVESDKHASILAATAPSEQSFIIETAENKTNPGDTVSGAAPIVSVSDTDLPTQPKVQPKKIKGGGLIIRDAVADEVVLNSPNITPMQAGPSTEPIIESKPVEQDVKTADKGKITTDAKDMVTGAFFVQVGSFAQEANAKKMQSSIESVGPSSVTRIDINGANWFRLRAGPFNSREEAMDAMDKIRTLGAPDARIMKL